MTKTYIGAVKVVDHSAAQNLKQRIETQRAADPSSATYKVKAEMAKMHSELIKFVDHAPAPNELPRVPTEIATHWIAGLKQKINSLPQGDPHRPALEAEYSKAQGAWMRHDLNTGAVHSMLNTAIAANLHPDVKKLAQQLDNEIAKHGGAEPPTTRLFDNVYGRTFESALVDHLVKNPPSEVKQSMNQLGHSLSESVTEAETGGSHNFACGLAMLQNALKGDKRVWSNEYAKSNPAYAKFLAHTLPSPQLDPSTKQPIPLNSTERTQVEQGKKLLKEMLDQPTQTGIDCIARPYVTVKLMYNFGQAHLPVTGRVEADKNYAKLAGPSGRFEPILDQRPAPEPGKPVVSSPLRQPPPTKGAGITLLHQPDAAKGPASGDPSSRPGHKNEPAYSFSERPESEGLSRVMSNPLSQHREMTLAHENGIPYVSGASGSTNLVLHYAVMTNFRAWQKHKAGPQAARPFIPPIDTRNSMLGTAMLLNHDGGHSMHEALWTMNQTQPTLRHGASDQPIEHVPGNFKSNYEQYFASFNHNPETRATLQAATQHAFDTTINVRNTHISDDAFVR